MVKDVLKAWVVGMFLTCAGLALTPRNLTVLILPLPVPGVAIGELYRAPLLRYYGFMGLFVMLGGALMGIPAFLWLRSRRGR